MGEDEVKLMDAMQKAKKTPAQILVRLQRDRVRQGGDGPSPASVYRFLSGDTHVRGRTETRGAVARLPHGLLTTANAERRKLIKAAANEYLVTWGDVHAATKRALKAKGAFSRKCRMPSQDWLERKMREAYLIRARPGKRRISTI